MTIKPLVDHCDVNQGKIDPYKSAGVDTEKGDELVDWLQSSDQTKRVRNKGGEVVSGIGGFAAMFRPAFKGMEDPLLVSGTDGVGTKILLALKYAKLRGLGIDLVAMCANDILTVGAQPLFFLDYYATGKLSGLQFKEILTGIRSGVEQSGAMLIGGETAELPGLYQGNDFDLAGFMVGIVDGPKTLGPAKVKAKDRLYAFASSGFHSNGYSLLRQWLASQQDTPSPELIDRLLAPTRIYGEIPELVAQLQHRTLNALAHITGGGISGNLPRILPAGLKAHIDFAALPTPDWMRDFILSQTNSVAEVEPVFNLGVGMIAVVDPAGSIEFEAVTKNLGLTALPLGEVRTADSSSEAPSVIYH